uniref:Elongator complex protein 5 n=2 Tax=Glossina morsitans morsitans TaxID=37546 RepID=D3TPY3_GLOMM
MLSNLIVNAQKGLIVFIDDLGEERMAIKLIKRILDDLPDKDIILKTLNSEDNLRNKDTWHKLAGGRNLNQSSEGECNKCNIILPPFSDMLVYQSASFVLQFLNKLKRCREIDNIFLWITPQHCLHDHSSYLIAGCEHMADVVVHIESDSHLTILKRKSDGGRASFKRYSYKRNGCNLLPELCKEPSAEAVEKKQPSPEQLGTFKIELEEDELVARNALKMPYEMSTNVTYTTDIGDNYDEEDPDDDLSL